jgi:hypothetical protein
MTLLWRLATAGLVALAILALPLSAAADHATRPHSANVVALGHSPNPASFFNPQIAPPEINSDLAFWGNLAFNGNYDGFRIIDISDPANPLEIVHQRCNGNQGDLVVWDDIVVRSWNSPAPADDPATPEPENVTCDGQPVPAGFEGLHVFDISNLSDPELVASVKLDCGSHTATGVPDLAHNRLIVYSNVSSGGTPPNPACDAIDIVVVPLDQPENTQFLRKEPITGGTLGSNNGCHDMGVILGDVNMAVCASGHAANVFTLDPAEGGSLVDPKWLYNIEEQDAHGNKVGVGGRWHSAAFTWDGEVIILGWEPGGGAAPECEATDPRIKKSMFFYDSDTGAKLGQWTLPHPQTAEENCTIHNYNIVPLASGRYVAVSGNYQAGTWVTDFTNPARPRTVAFSDPPPLVPNDLGGAWSSYWYNNFVYESSITEGLNVFWVRDRRVNHGMLVDHLNPQTQEFSLP